MGQCTLHVYVRAFLKAWYFLHFFKISVLQLGHATYQSIGKWGQEIRFQCQNLDSSTLTDARVTRYYKCRSFQINFIMWYIKTIIVGQGVHLWGLKFILSTLTDSLSIQLLPCRSFQINWSCDYIKTYLNWAKEGILKFIIHFVHSDGRAE